jgi:hypothetical protein
VGPGRGLVRRVCPTAPRRSKGPIGTPCDRGPVGVAPRQPWIQFGPNACAAYPASAFAFIWPSQATSEESSMFCIASLSALTGSPEKDSVVET